MACSMPRQVYVVVSRMEEAVRFRVNGDYFGSFDHKDIKSYLLASHLKSHVTQLYNGLTHFNSAPHDG